MHTYTPTYIRTHVSACLSDTGYFWQRSDKAGDSGRDSAVICDSTSVARRRRAEHGVSRTERHMRVQVTEGSDVRIVQATLRHATTASGNR